MDAHTKILLCPICRLHRRASVLRADRAVRVAAADCRTASTRHARPPKGAGLLPAGGAGAALVSSMAPRLAQLAADNRVGRSTADRYLYEGFDALAAVPLDGVAR
jgi:hypothetical protein